MVCCFPPSAWVRTQRGQIKICDLKPNDRVLVVEKAKNGSVILKETSFITFMHFESDIETLFITLKCDNGAAIEISEEHLLFKVLETDNWKAVAANRIQVGDTLIHMESNGRVTYPQVTSINTKVIKGMVAPLTKKGTLIINNFLVSCYAYVDSHERAHEAMAPIRLWHRLNCNIWANITHGNDFSPKQGIHPYAKTLMACRKALKL